MEAQITQNLNMSQKDEEEDQQTHNQLIKYHLFQKRITKQENPKHDTDWDHSKSKAHWNKKNKGYVVDQLYKISWKWPRHPHEKYLRILMDMIRRYLINYFQSVLFILSLVHEIKQLLQILSKSFKLCPRWNITLKVSTMLSLVV